MSSDDTISRLMLRVPSDLKRWLEAESIRNASSLNSEIVRAVREKMDRTAKA